MLNNVQPFKEIILLFLANISQLGLFYSKNNNHICFPSTNIKNKLFLIELFAWNLYILIVLK